MERHDDSATLTFFEPGAGADPLALREDDSVARRIFLAYTVRIPWISDLHAVISREDEACYVPVRGVKA